MTEPQALADRTRSVTAAPVPANVDGLSVRLITDPNDLQELTLVRTTDARTALARGLKEYLEQQELVWEGGRHIKFKRVLQTWSEPEDPAEYPALAIVGRGEARYDGYCVTQAASVTRAPGVFLRQASELEQFFDVTIWSADPVERAALTALLEDRMEPVDWMTGMRLELPYYFGARASYEKQSVAYDEAGVDAQRRWRRTIIRMQANVPQYVLVGVLPDMVIREQLTVSDASDA